MLFILRWIILKKPSKYNSYNVLHCVDKKFWGVNTENVTSCSKAELIVSAAFDNKTLFPLIVSLPQLAKPLIYIRGSKVKMAERAAAPL